jgi:hypothetical protein
MIMQTDEEECREWDRMLASCRKAAAILGEDLEHIEHLDWSHGRRAYGALWTRVKQRKGNGRK